MSSSKVFNRLVVDASGPYATQIGADRLRMLYGSLPIALLASLVNAAILGIVQSAVVPAGVVSAWVGAVALLTGWRFFGYYRFTRRSPLPAQTEWTRRFLSGVLLSGILWGAAAFLLYPVDDTLHQMFLVFVLAGMGAGAVTTLSAMWSAALAYLLPALLPLIASLFLAGTAVSVPMGSMAILFLFMVAMSALRARNTLVELLRARHAQTQADADLRLAAITFRSQEGILIADRGGRILRLNEAACRMAGQSEEALTGRPVHALLEPEDGEGITRRAKLNVLGAAGFWAGECRLRTRAGDTLPVRATVTAVRDEAGTLRHYVGHFQDMSAVKRAQARIAFQAHHDVLTALPNRWLLSERLTEELSRCRRHDRHGALLFIDLDHFKRINDALGHRIGDGLLKAVARRLLDHIRREDLAARFGGDEFALMLTDLDPHPERAAEQAREAGERLRAALAVPYTHEGNHLHLTASMGIALYPLDREDAETVLTRADTALYQVKERGRNALAFYQPDMQHAALARLNIETALRQALDEKQFQLAYQPQVDAEGSTVGLEALLRWHRPGHDPISPAKFIPVAEDSGLILPIGDWVLRTACATLVRWQHALPRRALPPLSVNVSAHQFFQADFVERVLACLEESGLDGQCLELELTEGVLLDDVAEARTKMHRLAERGIRFALDDFGTGYSSLRYLQQLPITTLKIDQSFVRGLQPDGGNAAIIRAIVSIARHLRLNIVAEGVETDAEAALLDELGCRVHQGYRYSVPLEEAECLAWLRARQTVSPASPAEQ